MKRNAFLRLTQGALAGFTVLALANATGFSAGAPVEGKPVPTFSMKTTAGKTVSNSSLKGKVVLLDFWATWCGPCKAASPLVQKLHSTFGKKGFVAIGANTFEQDNPAGAAKKYAAEHSYTYLFTVQNDKLAESWGVTGIPYFVLIDKKGVVNKVYRGYGPEMDKDLNARVAKLVAQ